MISKPTPSIVLPEDRRARQGVWLLVVSLSIFFGASMILYGVYIYLRLRSGTPIHVPKSFLLSTALLVGISLAMHFAVRAAFQDKPRRVSRLVLISLILAVSFFVVQGDGIYWLLESIKASVSANADAHKLTIVLVVLHAAHVVGGLVGLIWVYVNSLRLRYDHERIGGIYFCAVYWHFLDIVWVFLLTGFWIASHYLIG